MKALFVTPALACTLLFAYGVRAEEHHETATAGAHEAGGEHRDNTALFPQPKADVANKGTAPKPVELVAPAMHAKVAGSSVKLEWKASDGANSYHVQVATDPNFKWLTADDHWVKGTSFEAKDLEKGKLYYWRVAPWKDGNMAAANKGFFTPSSFVTE